MNNYNVIFLPSALNDIKLAKAWYNEQRKGLGKIFYADVKNTTLAIKRNPFFASIKYRNVRATLCNKFPYTIHYTINETMLTVYISAVYHTSREPLT